MYVGGDRYTRSLVVPSVCGVLPVTQQSVVFKPLTLICCCGAVTGGEA